MAGMVGRPGTAALSHSGAEDFRVLWASLPSRWPGGGVRAGHISVCHTPSLWKYVSFLSRRARSSLASLFWLSQRTPAWLKEDIVSHLVRPHLGGWSSGSHIRELCHPACASRWEH